MVKRLALLAALVVVPAHVFAAGLFGLVEIKANQINSIPKWVDVLGRTEQIRGRLTACLKDESACANDSEERWRETVISLRDKSLKDQVDEVNWVINRSPYITDSELWGKSDYWATPKQFLANSGDCEDYAIMKYFTLRMLGVADARLRMAVVHDAVRDIPHAILVVDVDDDFLILDNLSGEALSHRWVSQYTPYYAVNATSRWVFVEPDGR